MKTDVIKHNSEVANIAQQKLLFSKTHNRTEDETEKAGVDAAELVLSAAEESKSEVESQSNMAIERIQTSVSDAHQRIKFICDSAIEKIEVMMQGAIDKLEVTINERLARLG
jgi:LAS superfamily LD-carboxypeptidase LdcB